MSSSVGMHPPFVEIVVQGHATLKDPAESAMVYVLEGDPSTSVPDLLGHAERTMNDRLVDTATRTLKRYRARIDDAALLEEQIQTLALRYAASWRAPRLGQGTRAAGGLNLRDGSPAAQVMARNALTTDLPALAAAPDA